MRYFHNDYNLMCHQAVLDKLQEALSVSVPGYGTDEICKRAADQIRSLCNRQDLFVHFLVGGTQANLTVISASLRTHHAVICAKSGHINVHETGSIEATGHKIIQLPSDDGKITARQIAQTMEAHLNDSDREHTAKPKMVYISQSTEWGTVYSLQELENIHDVCQQYGLYMFVDGARLGYALQADGCDVTLPDLARLTDVFYIGGTKQGAMFGEAVVISNTYIAEDFRYVIKQRGGMLAKGWLLGLQFEALLEDGLYFRLAKQADKFAQQVRDVLQSLGYRFYIPGPTNQIFPILPDKVLDSLSQHVTFSEMGRWDETHRIVRFCISWGNTQEDVDYLCRLIQNFSK